jgi:hypothetical protein
MLDIIIVDMNYFCNNQQYRKLYYYHDVTIIAYFPGIQSNALDSNNVFMSGNQKRVLNHECMLAGCSLSHCPEQLAIR